MVVAGDGAAPELGGSVGDGGGGRLKLMREWEREDIEGWRIKRRRYR